MRTDPTPKKKKSEALKYLKELALNSLKARYPNNPYLPEKKYTDLTANGLTKSVIDFITFSGYQAERINSMGRQIDRRKTITDLLGRTRTVGTVEWIKGTSKPGTADISATVLGRSIKIEVKCKATGDNYQNPSQKLYQKEVEKAGGLYIIVRISMTFTLGLINS